MIEVEDRLRRVLSSVFGVNEKEISDADSPDTIAGWDSVAHVRLIVALEAEFGLEFEAEEIGEMVSVGTIRARVERDA